MEEQEGTLNFRFDESFGDLFRQLIFEKFINFGYDKAYFTMCESLGVKELPEELVHSVLLGTSKFVMQYNEMIVQDDDIVEQVKTIKYEIGEKTEYIAILANEHFIELQASAMRHLVIACYEKEKCEDKEQPLHYFFSDELQEIFNILKKAVDAIPLLLDYHKVLMSEIDTKYHKAEYEVKLHKLKLLQEKIEPLRLCVYNNLVGIEELCSEVIKNWCKDYFWLNPATKDSFHTENDVGFVLPNGMFYGVPSSWSGLAHVNIANAFARYISKCDIEKDIDVLKIHGNTVPMHIFHYDGGARLTAEQFYFFREWCKKTDHIYFDTGLGGKANFLWEDFRSFTHKDLLDLLNRQ